MTYYSESNKQEQDLWCKVTVYAYNSSIPSSIGYTHGRLLFGKECRILLDMFSTRRNNTQCSTTLESEDNLKHMKLLRKICKLESARQLENKNQCFGLGGFSIPFVTSICKAGTNLSLGRSS